MPLNENAVWFITGCSTGFGRELAQIVLKRGWRAVVTARDAGRVQDLTQGHEDNALALALDVNSHDQIADAVRQAEDRFGAIDVLVNNAGYGYQASIEEGDNAEIRAQFETNVFGLAAMTRAVLPGMRARRMERPACRAQPRVGPPSDSLASALNQASVQAKRRSSWVTRLAATSRASHRKGGVVNRSRRSSAGIDGIMYMIARRKAS